MSSLSADANVERLVRRLQDTLGSALRSVVEYSPQSSTIHYIRPDIDEYEGNDRLVRLGERYHSERLSRAPSRGDAEFGPLYASVYFFRGSVVVHVVEPTGVVYGVSIEHENVEPLTDVIRECLLGLYGEVPEYYELPSVN